MLHQISGCQDTSRKADVVFVHGLGGDAFETWRHGLDVATSWPHWLGDEFPVIGVWSLGYAASPTRWARLRRLFGRGSRDSGQSMPLPDRATQVLDLMLQNRLGQRPLLFVCHSLGGLLAKQIIRRSNDATDERLRSVVASTRAVLFLATPHAGAELASLANVFRTLFRVTVTMEDLRAHDAHLRELQNWYRNHAEQRGIRTVTYYETRDLYGVRVVNETSAHPGVGADPVGLDEDHLSIAKPRERDAQVCNAVREILQNHLLSSQTAQAVVGTHEAREARPAPAEVVIRLDRNALVGGEARVPHELPPAADRFFGRAAERQRLVDRLRSGRNTAVVGPAGFGKTALAADALTEVVSASAGGLASTPFPNGIVYLDLYRLHGEAEPAWNTIANRVCGAEFMDRRPARERATEACRARRLLIIVEGGEEADGRAGRTTVPELLGVLSPEGHWLLLTRVSAQATPAETVEVKAVLDPKDAAALLDSLTEGRPLQPGVRHSVLELLDGHPLGLTWAGSLLAREEEDASELLSAWMTEGLPRLSEPKRAERTLRWLFDRSVRALDDAARQALAAAGLLAHAPFPSEAIAVALGGDSNMDPAEAARNALRSLIQSGLLRRGERDWRFTHVLAYQFARDEEHSDPALRERLGQWVHAELEACLKPIGAGETRTALVRALQHAAALLRADADQQLWVPLAHGLLYPVADRLEDLGRLDLVSLALDAVAGWFTRLPAQRAAEPYWRTQYCVYTLDKGDLLRAQGDLAGALVAYRASHAVSKQLAEADASNATLQRELAVSQNRVADVLSERGDLAGALAAFRDSLAVIKRLAEADASNPMLQRDLSISQNKLGDVLRAQGDFAGALAEYRDSLAVRKRLAEADPSNTMGQRDLSVGQDRTGDVLRVQGDLAGALAAFRDSLAVRKRLAEADPLNTRWQRDLSVSQERIGDVLRAQGDLAGALAAHRDSLAVSKRLAEADTSNATWQRDLSVSQEKVGDVLRAQGDLAGALAAYRDALAVIRRLAEADASNATWQRGLSFALTRIAELHERAGHGDVGLPFAEEGLVIDERLAALDPTNVTWREDVRVSHALVARLREVRPSTAPGKG